MSQQQAEAAPPAVCTVDPYQKFQIIQNPDGTITRLMQIPNTPATPDLDSPFSVLSKDVPLNPKSNTCLRLFLPRKALDNSSPTRKFPLIVYYHGGGFVIASPFNSIFHDFCFKMADDFSAVIVSVKYRLAPEHRLPAAYDDAVEALHWLKSTDEKWVREFADVSSCYLMGTSAGGNIAYHVGLQVSAAVDEFDPLRIKGLILHHPFFGGSRRTESELRLVNDEILPLSLADLAWEFSLPVGADRDHKYCNPTEMDDGSNWYDELKRLGWRVLMAANLGDPLIDRQMKLSKMLRNRGIQVVEHFAEGSHGIEIMDINTAEPLFHVIKDFIEQRLC